MIRLTRFTIRYHRIMPRSDRQATLRETSNWSQTPGPGSGTFAALVIFAALVALVTLVCVASCQGRGCGCGQDQVTGPDRSDGRLPEVVAPQVAPGAITVDGRLDEPAWQSAGKTGPFVDPGSGRPAPESPVAADARLAWDEVHLYLGVVVRDANPGSPFHRDDVDPHVWARASGIELMLQPGDFGDNRHYFEVQVDVAGAVWDTRFDDYNQPRRQIGGLTTFGHQAWQSHVLRAVRVDRAKGRYVVELALPWAALRGPLTAARPRLAVPPRAGEVWRLNLYSFRDGQRAALAWSPILGQGNFHRASRFGRLRFCGP